MSAIKGKGFVSRDTSKSSPWQTRKARSRDPRSDGAAPEGPPGEPPSSMYEASEDQASTVPRYGFPIVYYFVNHAELTGGQLVILNNYINVQTNVCNRRPSDSHTHPFLTNGSEIGVLFMHWEISHHLEMLKLNPALYYATLNDLDFLNMHILGHAKLRINPPYLEIYNFCKHSFTITQAGISVRQPQFGYIGIAMFNALLTATSLLPANMDQPIQFDTLWLGIDVANPEFEKVAKIYTVCGFSNPIITNRTAIGAPIGITILQLTRPLHRHVSNHFDSIDNFNEAMSLMHQLDVSRRNPANRVVSATRVSSQIMKCRFSFDRSCILSLHLFPFISFNTAGAATGVSGIEGQRETSGKFVVIKSMYDRTNPTSGHDVYALETINLSPELIALKFTVGNVGSVDSAIGEATFHTHPIANYRMHGAIIGPPSSGDLLSFVITFIGLHYSGNQSFKFSLVSTVEGVHIISLSPEGIIAFMQMMTEDIAAENGNALQAYERFSERMRVITLRYEYPGVERAFRWDQHTIAEGTSVAALMAPMSLYETWFNQVNAANGNPFVWDWVPWDEFNVDHVIDVHYLENRIKLA